ncbi:MAG TPA: hypothetical protein VGV37_20485 [Aliidongia sp.]|uniref:hypothetical protein n=1 Tax=Aliidongia sp. TaxID=1914230 RepID=UPI002DDCFC19|nr:hypothetical protein [Aliidongia sp.]HEV2676917.1 hypothetical protein [Aliidongia sp.]
MDERAAHSTDRRGTSRTVAILAGLSLALNLLAGGAYLGSSYLAIHQAKPNFIDRRFADLGAKLGVDAGTDPGIVALHRAVKVAIEVRHIRSQPLVDDILAEFAKPAPDAGRIRSLQDAVIGLRRTSGDEVLSALIAFLGQATPKERADLIALLRDKKEPDTMPLHFGLIP